MNLKFKRPSEITQSAMSKVAIGEDDTDYHKIAEEKLSDATGHKHAKLVNSGNSAIFSVMNSIDGAVLIPDQGGWNGFKQIAQFLSKDLFTVNTNDGLISADSLEKSIENNLSDLTDSSALFLTSFAGYAAEQDINEIRKVLDKNGILLVEDASGAICDRKKLLANGKYSDIIIGSTGSPKIMNVGDGGFITTDDDGLFSKSNLLLKSLKCSNITACGISHEIELAGDNLERTIDFTMTLKKKISEETSFETFHKDKRGINIILKTKDPKSLSYKLRHELVLDSHGMITKCPNYNRLKEKAVAIEIKNLDISCLNDDNLNGILEIIKKYGDLA